MLAFFRTLWEANLKTKNFSGIVPDFFFSQKIKIENDNLTPKVKKIYFLKFYLDTAALRIILAAFNSFISIPYRLTTYILLIHVC